MQRKKGESAPKPAIFRTDIYDPNPKQQDYQEDSSNVLYARTENRLFNLPRRQKRDKKL